MKQINEILVRRNNVNTDNKNYSINDNTDNSPNGKKYALDRSKFTPNTEEAQLAETMASSFNDLDNFAFYFRLVKNLGTSTAYSFWESHREEEEEKRGTKYEFRSSKKYFAWKYKKGLFR